MSELALDNTLIQRLLRRVRKPWTRYVAQQELGRQTAFGERLLAQLMRDGQAGPESQALYIASSLLSRSGVVVAMIAERASNERRMVLKLPLTADAERSTTGHRQVVTQLHEQPDLQTFCALVPRPIAWGEYEGRQYYLETALPGVGAADLVRRQAEPPWMKQDAAWLIRQLHMGTLQRRVVDDTLFARLAGDDLELLQHLAERWPEAVLLRRRLDQLEDLLRVQLQGRELPFSWTHGDFWPGNLLLRSSDSAVSGIVDWDRAATDQMPMHDLLHLLAYSRKMQRRSELGEEIVSYLLPAAFDKYERTLIKEAMEQLELPKSARFFQAITLLYWLRFAAANLLRYPAFQGDGRWLKNNVFLVLKRGF
jgi:aminoglycoside phosphotransferase (APT) family kinase protein